MIDSVFLESSALNLIGIILLKCKINCIKCSSSGIHQQPFGGWSRISEPTKSYCLIIFLPINLLVIQKLLIWTDSKRLLFSFFLSRWVCTGVLRFFWSSQSDVSHASVMCHTSPRSCLVITLPRYIILGFQQELGESGDLTMRFLRRRGGISFPPNIVQLLLFLYAVNSSVVEQVC